MILTAVVPCCCGCEGIPLTSNGMKKLAHSSLLGLLCFVLVEMKENILDVLSRVCLSPVVKASWPQTPCVAEDDLGFFFFFFAVTST